MNLLTVMLFVLYPLSPALRLFELVRWFMGQVLIGFEDPDYVAELEEDPHERAKLHRWLCDMEYFVHIVIGYLARDKLGLPFRDHRYSNTGHRAAARLAKPLSVEEVFGRFERIVLMLADIEHLAARRARLIAREIDANPLGLKDHRPAAAAAELTDSVDAHDSISSTAIFHFSARGPPPPPIFQKRRADA